MKPTRTRNTHTHTNSICIKFHNINLLFFRIEYFVSTSTQVRIKHNHQGPLFCFELLRVNKTKKYNFLRKLISDLL